MPDQPDEKLPIRVKLLSLLPTQAGFAVFMEFDNKTGVIFIDPSVGLVLQPISQGLTCQRPLTHDLIHDMMEALGVSLRSAIIVSLHDGVYAARLILEMRNEVSELKIVELDIRASDAMAICLKYNYPLEIARPVWEQMEDVGVHYRSLAADSDSNMMSLS